MRQDAHALCEARQELRALMASPTLDPAAAQAATNKLKAAQVQLLDGRLKAALELRTKLTGEQWARLMEMRRQRSRGPIGLSPFGL
jgi:Spy/CpxP family protein refolding chaperone